MESKEIIYGVDKKTGNVVSKLKGGNYLAWPLFRNRQGNYILEKIRESEELLKDVYWTNDISVKVKKEHKMFWGYFIRRVENGR